MVDTFADAALLFAERHIQLPVQAIFDPPMAANGGGEATGRQIQAENIVANLRVFLAVPLRHIHRHADRPQFPPAHRFGHALGHRTDEVIAIFLAAVSGFMRRCLTNLGLDEIGLDE